MQRFFAPARCRGTGTAAPLWTGLRHNGFPRDLAGKVNVNERDIPGGKGEKRDFEGETDFIDGGGVRGRKRIYGAHSAPYGTWTMKPKCQLRILFNPHECVL